MISYVGVCKSVHIMPPSWVWSPFIVGVVSPPKGDEVTEVRQIYENWVTQVSSPVFLGAMFLMTSS